MPLVFEVLVRHKATGELYASVSVVFSFFFHFLKAMKTMEKAKFKAQKITSKAHSEQFILSLALECSSQPFQGESQGQDYLWIS